MASFDFNVHTTEKRRRYASALLRHSQRVAGRLHVKVRYRWTGGDGFYVTVDGSLPTMERFRRAITQEVRSYMEAAPALGLPRGDRVSIAVNFLRKHALGLDDMERFVQDVADRAAEFGLEADPLSYAFYAGTATHLTGTLRTLTDLLIAYDLGELSPAVLIEQGHTTVGLLLKALQPKPTGSQSFQQLVDDAVRSAIITKVIGITFTEMKNLRKQAKHYGRGVPQSAVDALIPRIIMGCHRLIAAVRRGRQVIR